MSYAHDYYNDDWAAESLAEKKDISFNVARDILNCLSNPLESEEDTFLLAEMYITGIYKTPEDHMKALIKKDGGLCFKLNSECNDAEHRDKHNAEMQGYIVEGDYENLREHFMKPRGHNRWRFNLPGGNMEVLKGDCGWYVLDHNA